MGDSRAFLASVRYLREQLKKEGQSNDATVENTIKARSLVIKVQEGSPTAEAKLVGEAQEDGAAESCFLCDGVRYIPVSERAEFGPDMFNAREFPQDWAPCPECNATGKDPLLQ